MFNIQIKNNISKIGLQKLEEDCKIFQDCEAPDGILVRSAIISAESIPQSVLAIARAGAGVNNIPVEECSKRGTVVFNTPGANANAVKELTITALLISSRKVPEAMNFVQSLSGKGDEVATDCEKKKSSFAGPELFGKTLGVIGLGAIGALVANAALNLGMKVLGYDPYLSVENAWKLSAGVELVEQTDEIYKRSDYITLHLPAVAETKGMIDKNAIDMMKDGARLINMSRKELIDSDAILLAVESKKLSRYVTDFAEEKLVGKENIIIFPHLGASTPEAEENCAVMAADQLLDYLKNGNICNSVNYPNASLARSGAARICIFHKNAANMLSQISGAISDAGLNITNLLNKSKGDYAYTIIDVDSLPNDTNLNEAISQISGVSRVRIILNR